MARRKILLEGDPILRKKSKPIVVFDKNVIDLFADMEETLEKEEGAGLSAVQVGILKRMFIIYDGNETLKVVNPEILSQSGKNKITQEGCLSIPGKWGDVERPNKVEVSYQDENGIQVKKELVGFSAKAFCHEFDHLNGILFIDKATNLCDSYEQYAKLKAKEKKSKK